MGRFGVVIQRFPWRPNVSETANVKKCLKIGLALRVVSIYHNTHYAEKIFYVLKISGLVDGVFLVSA